MVSKLGQTDIRGENISKIVNVWTQKKFKLKPLLQMVSTSDILDTYYQEDPSILTASGTRNIKGLGQLSEFPTVERSWTKTTSKTVKYGAEGIISLEDKRLGAFNAQERTLNGIVESIVNSEDGAIYAALTAETNSSGVVAATGAWDATTTANQKPINDILRAIQAIDENNYDAQENGVILLNPHDYASLMQNTAVINNQSFKTADIVSNGKMGQICGLSIVKSTSVSDDEAMILVKGKTATWVSAIGLESAREEDPGKSTLMRSWEMGQIQIKHPKALYTITGTEE